MLRGLIEDIDADVLVDELDTVWFLIDALTAIVKQFGYYDEPHLARLLRRYVGRSAQQLRTGAGGPIALDLDQCTTS